MDPIYLYLSFAIFLLALICLLGIFFRSRNNGEPDVPVEAAVVRPNRNAAPRVGGARRRMRNIRQEEEVPLDDFEEDEDDIQEDIVMPEGKVGAKKMKKLQEKAERRRQREAELAEREEKKQREEERIRKLKEADELEELEEKRKEEEEKARKEEQARKEHEEYLLLKTAFTVDEEGHEEAVQNLQNENLLEQFINYIKEMKVVMIEDLASHFNIKTQDCIDRINTLQQDDTLTGVLDDRGKFIYVTMQEMESVAKFIKQRGRVSITELASCSNKLINLAPENQEITAKLLTT